MPKRNETCFTARIDRDDALELKQSAKRSGLTRSELLRRLVREYLQKMGEATANV